MRHPKRIVDRVRLGKEFRFDRTGNDVSAFFRIRQRQNQFAV
jgi:hypothetical protein